MSTMRRPPNTVRMVTRPGSPSTDPSDDRGACAQRMRAHRRQRRLGLLGRHDRDDLALVGEIERIEPEDLAERLAPRSRSGVAASSISMRDLRGLGDLVEHRGHAAARRVAQEARAGRGRQQRLRSSPCSGAQSLSIGVSSARSPRAARIAAP